MKVQPGISTFDYLTAQVLHTGRSMIEWHPNDLVNNALIEAFMYKPTGDIIQLAVGDRKRALDLCNQSIEDIESVKRTAC